ncbi:MAG: FAD-dependent oxidoreductase, partial [bacterium]
VPAARFIESRGGRILTLAKIAGLIERDGRVVGAVAESGEVFSARATVSTLPPWDLARLALPRALARDFSEFKPSPIIGINLWLDRPILREELFVGLIGTDIQWVFNKSLILSGENRNGGSGQYLSLVISGARKHLRQSPDDLVALAERDLSACFPEFQKTKILRRRVIKEPFATLSPIPGTEALRPKPGLALPGFYLAGDWTKTGLPATIESAAAAGHKAALEIIKGEK